MRLLRRNMGYAAMVEEAQNARQGHRLLPLPGARVWAASGDGGHA